MSIVGYILGLGDHHPSNLMIHRDTRSIIHIDFLDCFEIAKTRILFPELILFRLTRMMLKTFGTNRVEGEFQITCEETLKIIRIHRYSILAVLDIFLQEPLTSTKIPNSRNSISLEIIENENDIWLISVENEKNIDIKNSIRKIVEKIMGNEYESFEEQVDELIKSVNDI